MQREKRISPQRANQVLRSAQTTTLANPGSEEVTLEELFETGAELGLRPEQVSTALTRIEVTEQIALAQAEVKQLAVRRAVGHSLVVATAAALAWALGWFTEPSRALVVCAVLWGSALLWQWRGALIHDPQVLRKQAKRNLARKLLSESGSELAEALQKGAAHLMSRSAKHIDHALDANKPK
jgi:hypothetical protein